MPNRSKQKGNRFEREIVKIAKSNGLSSKRAWGSNGASLGMHEEVDLTIGKNPQIKVQAKCRKKLASFLQPSEHVDVVICKQDRGDILVISRLNDWLEEKYSNMLPEDR